MTINEDGTTNFPTCPSCRKDTLFLESGPMRTKDGKPNWCVTCEKYIKRPAELHDLKPHAWEIKCKKCGWNKDATLKKSGGGN